MELLVCLPSQLIDPESADFSSVSVEEISAAVSSIDMDVIFLLHKRWDDRVTTAPEQKQLHRQHANTKLASMQLICMENNFFDMLLSGSSDSQNGASENW